MTSKIERWFEWRMNGSTHGWSPPPRARWYKRLPIVRFVRAVYHYERVERLALQARHAGIGLGHMNPYDVWVIEGIRDGWV